MIEIFRNIARRKLRSFLTISGIVIGVLALTTMGAVGGQKSICRAWSDFCPPTSPGAGSRAPFGQSAL